MFPYTLASGVETSNDLSATTASDESIRQQVTLACTPLLAPPFVRTAPALQEFHTHKRPFCGFSKPPHTMKAPPSGPCALDAFPFSTKCTCNLLLF